MRESNKQKQGYSLAEVVIAAGIFAMVIAGAISGVRMGFEIVDNARHHTRVSQILQSEVESLRSLSWVKLKELPADEELGLSLQFSSPAYDRYSVARHIYEVSSTLRRVEIVVNFSTRSGKPMSLRYVTFFTEGGVNDYFYRTI